MCVLCFNFRGENGQNVSRTGDSVKEEGGMVGWVTEEDLISTMQKPDVEWFGR